MKSSIIAERTLECSQDPRQNVIVKLARPKLNGKTKAYECTYQITGAALNLTRRAAGLDAFQAIQVALRMIGIEIEHIEKKSGLHLTFSDLTSSGFPR
jgi:hypothetical protein